jgi:crotonobetainyl-CoA:carnitine CoA-transferase CaiB-like acyl-CoA transferase
MTILGEPALATDPDFATNKDRVKNRDRLCATIAELTSGWPKALLLARLEAAGVPAGPINSVAEAFSDSQAIFRQMSVALVNDAAKGGTIASVRSPIVLDGQPMVATRSSPALGEG